MDTGPDSDLRPHRVHRLAHAVYGLIILTATVGELRLHEEDVGSAIAVVAAGGAVLVVAHSYSAFIAAAAVSRSIPDRQVVVDGLVDQLPLAIPAALTVGVLALAAGGLISLGTALDLALVAALVALFALGLAIGARHGKTVR